MFRSWDGLFPFTYLLAPEAKSSESIIVVLVGTEVDLES